MQTTGQTSKHHKSVKLAFVYRAAGAKTAGGEADSNCVTNPSLSARQCLKMVECAEDETKVKQFRRKCIFANFSVA